MSLLARLAAAAGLAALALTLAPQDAEAQYRGDPRSSHHAREWYDFGRHGRWSGPEGYFIVSAFACPDLREDLREARRDRYGRHPHYGRRNDWRDRQAIHCPPHAWDYVPSRREARAGRTGDRLRAEVAFYDRRSDRYYVETRWGLVPVHVDYNRRGYGHGNRYRHRSSGVHFEFRF